MKNIYSTQCCRTVIDFCRFVAELLLNFYRIFFRTVVELLLKYCRICVESSNCCQIFLELLSKLSRIYYFTILLTNYRRNVVEFSLIVVEFFWESLIIVELMSICWRIIVEFVSNRRTFIEILSNRRSSVIFCRILELLPSCGIIVDDYIHSLIDTTIE